MFVSQPSLSAGIKKLE
nr:MULTISPECIES: hypothetical protein [Fischerella]